MAKSLGMDSQKPGVSTELRDRLLFVVLALLVYRIGSHISVPGINTVRLDQLMEQQKDTVIGLFNMFSGGALARASLFALGIMPYISSAIIVQLLAVMIPSWAELKKEGESGKQKLQKYTRLGTLILGGLQAFGMAVGLPNMTQGLVVDPGVPFYITTTVTLLTGTMYLMWLGEQMTERGVGNGISLIIFAGIVAGLPNALGSMIDKFKTEGGSYFLVFMLIIAIVVGVTVFVVFIERALRKIKVNYAKRQVGNMLYSAPAQHLPLKINQSGVIPAIFASSIIMFPGTLASWFGQGDGKFSSFIRHISEILQPGQPLYEFIYAAAIIFFCFFYTSLVFNPREISENLKKSGAYIDGIRPGEATAKHIDKVMARLTFIGSMYMVFVCLVPQFMMSFFNVQFYFGGTSLLIVVVVVMDFAAQLATYKMQNQYGSILQKAHLGNYGR